MTKWIFFPSLLFFILGSAFYPYHSQDARAASLADGHTLVLYDAASGELPSSSLMAFTDFPTGAASLTFIDGATVLDTTVSGKETYAGWLCNPTTTPGFPILDRTTGFQVDFTMQIERETHANKNRAGFSMIILDQNAKGIEISFWENEIWVQSDDRTGGLFRHGEGATVTTTNLTEYQVTIVGDTYAVFANSEQLLSGPVRDYSSFSGFPDPYATPNFLFLGDDTTSSQARVQIKFVSVSGTEPIMPTIAVTSTGTAIPMETPSSAPLPSATSTSFPTPVPAQPVVQLCPSGWLFGLLVITNVMLIKRLRRRRTDNF